MTETIKRLRAAREQILKVGDLLGEVDLRYVAEDIQTSIAELEKAQAVMESLAPAFMSVDNAARKAFEAQAKAQAGEQSIQGAAHKVLGAAVRKTRCTCGTVNVSSGLKGYTEHIRGLTDWQCPIHGNPDAGSADV